MYHSKKRISLSIICASFMALGFAGCSEDTNNITTPKPEKPGQTCNCTTGENCSASELKACPDNDDTCPAECPDDCTDGVCNTHENCPAECPDDCTDGVCNTHDTCPTECPNDCTDGICNTHGDCPAECPNSCEDDGECPLKECPEECPDNCYSPEECTHEDNCPAECPDNCNDDGVCNPVIICPEECPDNCNDDGNCLLKPKCPEECPDNCKEDLTCPDPCPPECPGDCDDNHQCHVQCPAECPDNCNDDKTCKCSTNCKNGCDEKGACKCPDDCKNGCDETNGTCKCPTNCKNGCDSNGACTCPTNCKNGCNETGACKCPSSCETNCNENGECPVKCGTETVTSMYFSYKELDLLTPTSTGRKSANMTVYIKTDKNTYNMENAPCKNDIQLTMADKSIATVAKNATTPKNATFTAVAAGKTTCTVKLKGQTGLTGSITVRVLNLDRINDNIAKESDGKYPHLFKKPLAMISTSRVSQGFDFYKKNEFMYFTQLPKVKTNQTTDQKTTYDRTEMNIFKHDYTKKSKPMIFHGSGHGQNLSVENIKDKDYLWFANYGNLICSDDKNTSCTDGYKQSQIISRVLWEEGKTMYPSDATENYYYKDKEGDYYYSFEPALDTKNNKFAFRAYYHKDGKTYVRIYHLSHVKAIPNSTEKYILPYAIKWINENNELKTGVKPSLIVKDLATIKPIYEFNKSKIAVQGLELENGIIYTVYGLPKKLAKADGKYLYKSEIPLYMYNINGKTIGGPKAMTTTTQKNGDEYTYYLNTSSGKKEKIEYMDGETKKTYEGYFLNNSELDNMVNFEENGIKYEHNGYFEPEGIRVDDGKLYLSVTARYAYKDKNGADKTASRQVIFVYDLAK